MQDRLSRLRVEGLFDLYTHDIRFNTTERITAIIGPNGRGKTVCLKLIEALFRRRYSYFMSVPFRQLCFTFETGRTISIRRNSVQLLPDQEEGSPPRLELSFRSSRSDDPQTWSPTALESTKRAIELVGRYLPFLDRMGPNEWLDERTGDIILTSQILDKYSDRLPNKLLRALIPSEPEEFSELVESIECHLIETQRLLALPSYEDAHRWRHEPPGVRRRRLEPNLMVQQKAEQLKSRLQAELAKYATLSQTLDRSFPRRVIEASSSNRLSEQEIKRNLDELDNKRRELMTAGILDTSYEPVTIAGTEIGGNLAGVLEIYVRDTTQKLNVFDELLSKILVLKELISTRFANKRLEVDRANGLKMISDTGTEVPLDKLSSGEQHQLIMIFDLLFEVKRNSLILIDEPELSLHVAWQKRFIDDLTRMISLNEFDVILATHSPQLIGRHFNLAVELGDVEE